MRYWRLVLGLFLLTAVFTACGGQSATTYTTYTTESGISFDYPEEWVLTESSDGEINFASSQDVLDSGSVKSGAAGTVFVSPSEMFGDDMMATLDSLVKFMTEGEEEGIRVVEPARTVTVNGQEGAKVKLAGNDNGIDVTLTATLLQKADTIVFVMLIYDNAVTADMAPIVTYIESSVAFSE